MKITKNSQTNKVAVICISKWIIASEASGNLFGYFVSLNEFFVGFLYYFFLFEFHFGRGLSPLDPPWLRHWSQEMTLIEVFHLLYNMLIPVWLRILWWWLWLFLVYQIKDGTWLLVERKCIFLNQSQNQRRWNNYFGINICRFSRQFLENEIILNRKRFDREKFKPYCV